mmetsp:Transcript_4912/g.8204  ORF Transcript_4912/g.8204 Transcript_4912/m.8204 type:complete len:113 (-) Transcript_4912:1339-1677(-)|eukprot:CAMPEP_0184357096 /NCGR_PEP_ID=MMETSP1089-20130417/106942_1 /TAXON_ID=38269 ORGANISM="Gloeochaete wittrockiana, Strain SAG46.84" /NCGR_SAMPLE_ID=MMETSP1089 /ASSEMBLY_ACC=CAM_ASM_000445 /LENGTH=112 /DNA_ID=CAMNT_0026694675 /DNA_START=287 /DNA_END=625 /DNA_ORIENTATION=+
MSFISRSRCDALDMSMLQERLFFVGTESPHGRTSPGDLAVHLEHQLELCTQVDDDSFDVEIIDVFASSSPSSNASRSDNPVAKTMTMFDNSDDFPSGLSRTSAQFFRPISVH